jgi:hypothetical protein
MEKKSNDLKWHVKQWQDARYNINTDMKRMMFHAKEIKRLQNEKLDNRVDNS